MQLFYLKCRPCRDSGFEG